MVLTHFLDVCVHFVHRQPRAFASQHVLRGSTPDVNTVKLATLQKKSSGPANSSIV
jgi:hypothetical protein